VVARAKAVAFAPDDAVSGAVAVIVRIVGEDELVIWL